MRLLPVFVSIHFTFADKTTSAGTCRSDTTSSSCAGFVPGAHQEACRQCRDDQDTANSNPTRDRNGEGDHAGETTTDYWGGDSPLGHNDDVSESAFWSEEEKERCRYYDPNDSSHNTTDEAGTSTTARKVTGHGTFLDNVWGPGDLTRMYERILREYRHLNPTVLSRPAVGGVDAQGDSQQHEHQSQQQPWILTLEDFATPEECRAMIRWAEYEIQIEQEYIEKESSSSSSDREEDEQHQESETDSEEESGCRSTQAWCMKECMDDPIVKRIAQRVERLVGIPWEYAEELHFIRYVPGQEYTAHHDYIQEEFHGMHGPRLFTLYLYWNDVPPGMGGETYFPLLEQQRTGAELGDAEFGTDSGTGSGTGTVPPKGIGIRPKCGRALLWPNVLDSDPRRIDNRTYHEAKPLVDTIAVDHDGEGTQREQLLKYGTTIWFHLRNYSYVDSIDCINSYPA